MTSSTAAFDSKSSGACQSWRIEGEREPHNQGGGGEAGGGGGGGRSWGGGVGGGGGRGNGDGGGGGWRGVGREEGRLEEGGGE